MTNTEIKTINIVGSILLFGGMIMGATALWFGTNEFWLKISILAFVQGAAILESAPTTPTPTKKTWWEKLAMAAGVCLLFAGLNTGIAIFLFDGIRLHPLWCVGAIIFGVSLTTTADDHF